MAIYAIGAYFDGDTDVSDDFVAGNFVGIGWSIADAPELHQFLSSLRVGDIVYIKAAPFGGDIIVKAIGIIRDATILTNTFITIGRNVRWLNSQRFIIPKPAEKNNVRSNSMYEEHHPQVQFEILSRI